MTDDSIKIPQENAFPAAPALDVLLPFQLETASLRGRYVRLGPVLDTILGQHAYPTVVGEKLAGAVALACVLASSLKYDGVFTLQTKSDGPLHLLVADVSSEGHVRACANFRPQELDGAATSLIGKGHLAFTVDQKAAGDRYQGIVALDGDDLTAAVQTYFLQSEQVPTALVMATRRDEAGHWYAGCLMLQRMPQEGGKQGPVDTASPDDWHRAMMLMQTATEIELTDPALTPEDLLFRLFHEEGVRVFASKSYVHRCRCSAERVDQMLRSLPADELKALAVDGIVEVKCEFCGKAYRWDVAALEKPE